MGLSLRKHGEKNKESQPDPVENNENREPPETDPRLPLNAREVFRLTSSWKAIKRNMEATGVEMFVSFFKQNDSLKGKFSNFKNLALDDNVYENEALVHHASLVMGALDRAISNLHNLDQVLDTCSRVGASHRRFPGFSPDLFKRMEEPFLQAVKTTLDDRYNEQIARIYSIITAFLLNEISQGYIQRKSNSSHSTEIEQDLLSKTDQSPGENTLNETNTLKDSCSQNRAVLSEEKNSFPKDNDKNHHNTQMRSDQKENDASLHPTIKVT